MGAKLTDDNRLSIRYPDIAAEWHPTKNEPLTPHDVSYASGKKVWWRCEDEHDWDAVVASRTSNGTGCRFCSGRCPTDATRLSVLYPDLVDEWHWTKNEPLTPDKVSYASHKKVWWRCKEQGHEWKVEVFRRTIEKRTIEGREIEGIGCPQCARGLSVYYPDVAAEWHPTKNGGLTPDDVTYGSNKKVWWRCKKRGHVWEAVISSRTVGKAGCAKCKKVHTSNVETYLRCELSSVFPDIDPRNTLKIASWRVDVMIPSEKLVLEYDSWYRHDSQKSYARDMRKTEELKARGWTVIRIRETPLGRIQSHDLIVDVTFPGDDNIKLLTDNVLRHIEKVLGKDIPGVDEYLARHDLAQRDLAIEIIDEPPHPTDQHSLF